jgi:glycosyltransferase involved in cell wall biosynthesis
VRVLQVYRDYFTSLPGGIERHVHDLAHGLAYLGSIEVAVSSGANRPVTQKDGPVTVHYVREFGRINGLPITPGFVDQMRSGFDIIHLHSPHPTAELALSVARSGATGVLTYHADLDRGRGISVLHGMLLKPTLAACRRVLVSSERLIERSPVLRRLRARRPDCLEVVPFGVDTERFSPLPSDSAARLKQEFGPEPIVLFVGRLRRYKGLRNLIEAMRSVAGILVVVGDGPQQPEVVRLGEEVLGARFAYVPRVGEAILPDYYRAADVFALPSTSSAESFGLAALEAMASGLPVISTEVGTATSTTNVHGDTGLVVPPGEDQPLADALRALLGDSALRARMGQEGRRRAVAHFQQRQMLARVATIYGELLGRWPHAAAPQGAAYLPNKVRRCAPPFDCRAGSIGSASALGDDEEG